MKKIIIIVCVLITIYFWNALTSLLLPKIDGVKYYSFLVSGGEGNGYSYYLYDYPKLTYTDIKEHKWKTCEVLDEGLLSLLKHITDWPDLGPNFVVNRSTETTYYAYIKNNNKVIYIVEFADYGGAGPSDDRKKVCDKWAENTRD